MAAPVATSPDAVRAELARVAAAASAELQAAADDATSSGELATVLYAITPVVVTDYTAGATALALDWYEDLRDGLAVPAFDPVVPDGPSEALVASIVATSLAPTTPDVEEPFAAPLRLVTDNVVELIASSFRGAVTDNVREDPGAVGWRRFARPGACKFCLMLAARGAVYTQGSARFAAHGAVMNGERKGGNCLCLAGPAFDDGRPIEYASALQYRASKKRKTAKDRALLREYLNENFPDARG